MAKRKTPKAPTPIRRGEPEMVLMGGVRQAPTEVREGGRVFRPVVAVWVRAEDGFVVGVSMEEPDNPARTLVQTLLQAFPALALLPKAAWPTGTPTRLVLFDEGLAQQARAILASPALQIAVSPPFAPFDELLNQLITQIGEGPLLLPPLDLPDVVLRPLAAASERLWRAKPWTYTLDYPPFALVPARIGARPLFASVLGAQEEVPGVALYTSLADYEASLVLGEAAMGPSPGDLSPEAGAALATEALQAMRQRTFLVSFEPKDEVGQPYREQFARCGWSRRLSTLPTFVALGGDQTPGFVTAQEAEEISLAIDALVTFCERHRKQVDEDALPIRDVVTVDRAGQTVGVDVSVPGEDPSAPPATIYRLKVTLADQRDVWRTIDVRSNQTLEDLHYTIQDAFGWDDDHLYSFFLSGKAWDPKTEYSSLEALTPGKRSARVRLDRLGLQPRKRFLYIFDFGDEWRHDIRVEKAGLPPDKGRYPRIVEVHGDPPPQYDLLDEDEEEG